MEFFEVIKKRHSIRAFQSTPVEEEKLQQILEATNLAPSAGNLQAYEIYVATNETLRMELARAAYDQKFIAEAPVVLVFFTHPALSAPKYGNRGIKLYSLQDATIACTIAMLAATSLGLASVWVGSFQDEEVQRIINAPREQTPVAILPIGYAAKEPSIRPRRRLSDLVHEV